MWKRWNKDSHIWERSTNNGSSWTPLPINAASINEGTFAKGIQHPQTVYQDQIPTFTGAIRLNNTPENVGSWADYACNWTALGTPPTLGNGTLRARRMVIEKTVFFYIGLSFGTTTNPGSGQWLFDAPFDMLAAYIGILYPVFFGSCTGPSLREYTVNGHIVGVKQFSMVDILTGGLVGVGIPFTWGSGCGISINGYYEGA